MTFNAEPAVTKSSASPSTDRIPLVGKPSLNDKTQHHGMRRHIGRHTPAYIWAATQGAANRCTLSLTNTQRDLPPIETNERTHRLRVSSQKWAVYPVTRTTSALIYVDDSAFNAAS